MPRSEAAEGSPRSGIAGCALDEELRLYRQALAQANDAVVITTADGVIRYVNAAFARITGYAADEVIGKRPRLLRSGEHDTRFYAGLWGTLRLRRSFRGIFINRHKNGTVFHEEQTITPITDPAACITHYVATGRKVMTRIAREHRLRHSAGADLLTGLPSRTGFLHQLDDYVQPDPPQHRGLVLRFDIHNLRELNESLGRHAGDHALCEIADRLQSFCQGTGHVARWGGEAFAMRVTACGDAEQAGALAHEIQDRLGQPVNLGTRKLFLSVSIGIARYPQDARCSAELISQAELALQRARDEGPTGCLFYRDSMRADVHHELQLEIALRGALERNELHVVFQPIVRSVDGRTIAFEALLRWESPTLGSVPPSRFIPSLESTGRIGAVGRWVLETACAALAGLSSGSATAPRVCVNVSPRQLLQPGFVAEVRGALENAGLAPQRLELEITESVLIENPLKVADVLCELHQLGVRLAADDFGTEYSSLRCLCRFPFSTLKIDQSFVARMTHDAQARVIVSAILFLARGLDLDVVAEGIETERQFEFLKALGCPSIQGYWTGRPGRLAASQADGHASVCAA